MSDRIIVTWAHEFQETTFATNGELLGDVTKGGTGKRQLYFSTERSSLDRRFFFQLNRKSVDFEWWPVPSSLAKCDDAICTYRVPSFYLLLLAFIVYSTIIKGEPSSWMQKQNTVNYKVTRELLEPRFCIFNANLSHHRFAYSIRNSGTSTSVLISEMQSEMPESDVACLFLNSHFREFIIHYFSSG